MTIFSEALFALVGGHLMALSFFTAGHDVVVL
jgi:H2-forming N5,N10-methylenetetrahydromethanopterin dehydrogenase-like enzyme